MNDSKSDPREFYAFYKRKMIEFIFGVYPYSSQGGRNAPPLDLFENNFFIVAGIDLKFSVNSQLSFSDHMKFFRDRSGS